MIELHVLDPRSRNDSGQTMPLHVMAQASLKGDVAARAALRLELDALLESGQEDVISALLRQAPSAECYRHIQQFLAKLVNKPEKGETLIARLFALPLVIVAGAKKRLSVSAVLPDIGAVTALLTEHAVLGGARNVGLGNTLCDAQTLQCLPVRLLREWATQLRTGGEPLELAGSALDLEPGREHVHLRFLVGATVGPAHVASVLQDNAPVGAWAMPLTRLLAKQLALPDLEILPIPRAPVPLLLAPDVGRLSQLELSLSLFLSNNVRQFRLSVGDPSVVVTSHHIDNVGAECRISLSSPFDESMLEGFRWPIYPQDDFADIKKKIEDLLNDIQLHDVMSPIEILEDLNGRGGRFWSVRDFEALTPKPTH
ncbi:MAG: hypothetical protein WCH96_05925 [Betaproteobacteria bacterium]